MINLYLANGALGVSAKLKVACRIVCENLEAWQRVGWNKGEFESYEISQ